MTFRTLDNFNLPPNYQKDPLIIKSINDVIKCVQKYIKNNNDIEKIKKAAIYVKDKFKNIKRKNGDPFYYHLLTTSFYVAKWKSSPSMIIAALLHDLIEDIEEETKETVKTNFGAEVAFLVDKVTKIRLFEKSHAYILGSNMRKILLGMSKDVRVMVIKMADRMNNIETLFYLSKQKQHTYAKETLTTYVPIARALGFNKWARVISNLCFWFLNRNIYYELYLEIGKIKKNNPNVLNSTLSKIKNTLNDSGINFLDIYGREKSIYSIYKKIQKKSHIKNINDIFAIRVICETNNDCYAILGLIHEKFKFIREKFKDYIATPKGNMYQSLHTIIMINTFPFEIQIRTKEMHEIAELGIAAHWKYKDGSTYSFKQQQQEIMSKIHILKNIITLDESSEKNQSDFQWWKDFQEEIFSETITCLTPNKKIIELKKNSTVLDFAFHIHTEIGLNAIYGIVNGIKKPLRTKLEVGDVVEIITQKKPNYSLKWISWVTTPSARNKLRKVLNKNKKINIQQKDNYLVEIGKNTLNNFIQKKNLTNIYQMNRLIIEKYLLDELKVFDMDGVYLKLAKSKKILMKLFNFIFSKFLTIEEKINFSKEKITKEKKSSEILIDNLQGLNVGIAKCCNPIYGDEIVALVSRRSGLKVHRLNCKYVENLNMHLDSYSAFWNKRGSKTYKTKIIVELLNSKKIIDRIISTFALQNIKINSFNKKTIDGTKLLIKIEFYIPSIIELSYIINKLLDIKDILKVTRE